MSHSRVFLTATLLIGIVGCASQPAMNSNNLAMTTASTADEPAAPPISAVAPVVDQTAVAAAAEENNKGVRAVAKKLQKNRLTQFWRETNTYSYFVGSSFEAVVKPGDSLTLRDDSQENGVTCKFGMDGKLAADAAASQSRCDEMMFTLDQQLTD